MGKDQTNWPLVTCAILSILWVVIFFASITQSQQLFPRNSITAVNAVVTPSQDRTTYLAPPQISTKNPVSTIDRVLSASKPTLTMKSTPPETSSNPTGILESFMSPKAMLASAIDQIRNSTASNDNKNKETSLATTNATLSIINPAIILLSHQIIPPKDFMPVYDSMPYQIMDGQLFAKLPCDTNSKPPLQILVGRLLELKPAQLKSIAGLSHPGYMCMYQSNLTSNNNDTVVPATNSTNKEPRADNTRAKGNFTITYIELFNPSVYRVVLPNTASISISANQIMPLEESPYASTTGGVNQTSPPTNQTSPPTNQTSPPTNQTSPPTNQTAIQNAPNQLTRTGISPTIAFVYNAWNPYLKQKTYLPIAPLVNQTILSNSKCAVHAFWQSPSEEQSDLAELKEYLLVTNNSGGNTPMRLYMCGGAPIP
jgi:hypothetical protein